VKGDKVMEDASIRIFNLYGQEVGQLERINSNYVPLFGEEFRPGVYIYRLADSNGDVLFTGKFVVN
jgi:hypothetical protein